MPKLTPLSGSYTYGRVTVCGIMPVRRTEYLRSRNLQCYPIIISADMSCDDDNYPVYYLKATHRTWASYDHYATHNLANIFSWNVTNYNITVAEMRQLLVEMLPLVAALKHYTHFPHCDNNKLVNAAAAVNACVIRHMATTNAAYKAKHNV